MPGVNMSGASGNTLTHDRLSICTSNEGGKDGLMAMVSHRPS